jgi:hypothetical protein
MDSFSGGEWFTGFGAFPAPDAGAVARIDDDDLDETEAGDEDYDDDDDDVWEARLASTTRGRG